MAAWAAGGEFAVGCDSDYVDGCVLVEFACESGFCVAVWGLVAAGDVCGCYCGSVVAYSYGCVAVLAFGAFGVFCCELGGFLEHALCVVHVGL